MKRGGLLNKHFCEKNQISPISDFPISLWKLEVAMATRVLIRPEQKHNFMSPICRCYMFNMERIGLTASEEISFENVDGRRTDGRTPDACIYYKLTYEPTAQVS